MDWNLAIEKNREALKRVLAMLVAMAGLPVLLGRDDAGIASDRAHTLPRHLHRFVLRLLRPAEAAARRLIILAARGLVVGLPPPRIAKPKPQSIFVRNGVGTGIVLRSGMTPDWARAIVPPGPATLSLPLLDPLPRWGARPRPKHRSVPRITFDFDRPRDPDPPPLSADDPLDAGRLHRRLEAIGRTLDDLPRQARRLARWQAHAAAQGKDNDAAGAQNSKNNDAGPIRRLSPMRPGRPPGWRRRPTHEVYEILDELHVLAIWARERPDTS